MENEENRGLINKKVYEDQFTIFLIAFGWSSFSILSYAWTLVFLKHSNIGSKKAKEGQTRQRENKIKQGRVGSSNYNMITCRYQFYL